MTWDERTNPEYKKDLEEFHKKQGEIKENCFSYLGVLYNATAMELLTHGYRNMSNAQAMEKAYKHFINDMERLDKNFLKKYPD